jgi:hypothetical protein
MRQIHQLQDTKGWSLQARDGEIGSFQQIYFDDQEWKARYLVVRTGSWLLGRQVLIAPRAVTGVDANSGHITVDLSRSQIENSPPTDTEKPVSRPRIDRLVP